ncbi:MAG: FAD:protein FMN transferase [Dehalococcoidia bacterium]
MQHSTYFRAMNTDIEVLAETTSPVPPLELFIGAKLLFEEQEQRFSRFRPGSLLSEVNAGRQVEDEALARVCRMAIEAWEFTGGRFNPMVLDALIAAGYDRSFETVGARGEPRAQAVPAPAEAIRLEADRVSLSRGQLDLGGIVKGWTVDLLIESYGPGLDGLFVNAGGDLRCSGSEEGVDGWRASIDGGAAGATPWEGAMRGAVATSTSAKRRWRTAAGSLAHHLIDPATGEPSTSEIVQASVWANECWRAEAWAKAVVIGGRDALAACRVAGLAAMTIAADGSLLGRGPG